MTGPKISSLPILISDVTLSNTVGAMKKPSFRSASSGGPPPVTSFAFCSMPEAIKPRIRSYCCCDTIGPISAPSSQGNPI